MTLAAAVPAAVLVCLEVVVLLAAAVGEHPRWPDMALNLSEAAAVRDHAEIARQIGLGEDPNVRRTVRAGLVGNEQPVEATPLEAAISIRRPELVTLLFDLGAQPSPQAWLRLRCAAEALEYDDIVDALEARRPAGLAVACSGRETLW